MKKLIAVTFLIVCFAGTAGWAVEPSAKLGPHDWPWWRGPERTGTANPDQDPPLQWNDSQNIVWKRRIPGKGHGSLAVVGERLFVATAELDKNAQSIICLARDSGAEQWQTVVHQGGVEKKGNKKASLASSTPACDGERVYISFLNGGAIHTSALSLDGELLWQTKITDYTVHQGYGSSPTLYGSLVLISADNKGGGALAALDRETGKVVWKHARPSTPNYPSPIVLDVAGRPQLIMVGCDLVASYDPKSGEKLWEIEGATTECVTSTVAAGELVYSSGGYPRNHVAAIRADGSGEVVWEDKTRVYVPSMLVHQDHLFAVADAGVAMCWNAQTGKVAWKGRIGGTFSASPIRVGDRIYATNESGVTTVFAADTEQFRKLAENKLGDEVLSTAVICGSRIYHRIATHEGGERLETIYCLGKK